MGELRRRREGGRGHCYRIVANLGHDRICCCVPQTHSVKILLLQPFRSPAQRIFFVSVLRLIFCAPTLFAARVNALHSFYEPVPKIQI